MAPAYGAQQRVLHLATLISRFADVSFVIVPSEKDDPEVVRRTTESFNVRKIIRPIITPRGSVFERMASRFRHEFDRQYMGTEPYIIGQTDREEFLRLVGEYDVVWVHTIRIAHWFRLYRWPRSVLDADDLPSRQYESAARSGASIVRRALDFRMQWIWKRREQTFLGRFSAITVCSRVDRQYLSNDARVFVVPNGAPIMPIFPRAQPTNPRIGFLGNCEFEFNVDGLKWFIDNAWTKIKKDVPSAELRLVGRGSDGLLAKSGPDIVGLGWLSDPGPEIATWSAMIVPIKVGAGTRVKMAEGIARRCPIVTTKIGAFGYELKDRVHVLFAEQPAEFAAACILLLTDPNLGLALSSTAYKTFLEEWTWDSFGSTIQSAVESALD